MWLPDDYKSHCCLCRKWFVHHQSSFKCFQGLGKGLMPGMGGGDFDKTPALSATNIQCPWKSHGWCRNCNWVALIRGPPNKHLVVGLLRQAKWVPCWRRGVARAKQWPKWWWWWSLASHQPMMEQMFVRFMEQMSTWNLAEFWIDLYIYICRINLDLQKGSEEKK